MTRRCLFSLSGEEGGKGWELLKRSPHHPSHCHSFFKENPAAFYTLAKELLPGRFQPTCGHIFLRLLSEKGILLRNYTQNIDNLELAAGR